MVRLEGFEGWAGKKCHVRITHENGLDHDFGHNKIRSSGEWQTRFTADPGLWTVTASFEQDGLAARTVDVPVGGFVEVLIRPEDIVLFEGTVAVAGTLAGSDGAPLPGRELVFSASKAPGLAEGTKIKAVTDGEGRFSASGFKPGRWSTTLGLDDGISIVLEGFVIPMDAPDPVSVNLELPVGSVSGTLLDGLTGQPLDARTDVWSAAVRYPWGNSFVCFQQGGTAAGRNRTASSRHCSLQHSANNRCP